jgi:Flp pilus assembly protein TadG
MVAIRLARRLRGARGAELVEMALILPILLVVIAGIIDFALMFQAAEVVTNAAREGARVRVLPGYNDIDVQTRVDEYLAASSLTGWHNTVVLGFTIGGGGGGAPASNGVEVNVAYQHRFIALGPILALVRGSFASAITLNATSRMRMEL